MEHEKQKQELFNPNNAFKLENIDDFPILKPELFEKVSKRTNILDEFKQEFLLKKSLKEFQACFWFKFIADHYRYMIEFDEEISTRKVNLKTF